MARGQVAVAYTSAGGVCMVKNKEVQEVEVIHTVPKMTQTERLVTERRIANDLYNVLSEIYSKLQSDSE